MSDQSRKDAMADAEALENAVVSRYAYPDAEWRELYDAAPGFHFNAENARVQGLRAVAAWTGAVVRLTP